MSMTLCIIQKIKFEMNQHQILENHHGTSSMFPHRWSTVQNCCLISQRKIVRRIATAFSLTRSFIQSVLNRRTRLERIQMKQPTRSGLSLGEKLQILHYHSTGMKLVQIQLKFKISPGTFCGILRSDKNLCERDSNVESVDPKVDFIRNTLNLNHA